MKFDLPVLEGRDHGKCRVAVCANRVRRPFLGMLQVGHIALLVVFQDVGKNRVAQLDGARLGSVKVDVVDAVQHVVGAARHEIRERSDCAANARWKSHRTLGQCFGAGDGERDGAMGG